MITCARHNHVEADYYCESCKNGLCEDCVDIKEYSQTRIHLCPLCGFAVVPIQKYKNVRPFWKNLSAILSYPWKRKYWWVTFAGVAAATVVLRGVFAGGFWDLDPIILITNFGVGLILVYYLFVAFFFYQILKETERGNFNTLGMLEGVRLQSFLMPLGEVLAALPAAFLPAFVVYLLLFPQIQVIQLGHGFNLEWIYILLLAGAFSVFVVYGIFMLPLILMVLGVSDNFKAVMSPHFLWMQIIKIKKEYIIACALFYGILIVYIAARLSAYCLLYPETAFLKVPYYAASGAAELYIIMILGHLLGYVAHQCRFQLEWTESADNKFVPLHEGKPVQAPAPAGPEPEQDIPEEKTQTPDTEEEDFDDEEELAEPGSAEDINNKLKRAGKSYDRRLYQEAAVLYQEALRYRPENKEALQGLHKTAIKQNDWRVLFRAAREFAEVLWKDHELSELWSLLRETQKFDRDFTFRPQVLREMALHLEEQEEFLEAARVYRELGVRHRNHELAVPALTRCALLLEEKEDRPDTALKVWETLRERYRIEEVEGVDMEEKTRKLKEKIKTDPQKYLG